MSLCLSRLCLCLVSLECFNLMALALSCHFHLLVCDGQAEGVFGTRGGGVVFCFVQHGKLGGGKRVVASHGMNKVARCMCVHWEEHGTMHVRCGGVLRWLLHAIWRRIAAVTSS